MPFNTRRSSTRFTPRTFVGSNGSITDHSKSDKSNRAIVSLPRRKLNQNSANLGIPFMGT
jgi:hypothetical protein